MSSLLSHHNLSRNAVANFLRGYKHSLPMSPADWAAAESLGLEVGSIIVCLEPVVPLTATADRSATADTFKVTDLSVVIGKDNERPIVIRINAETYELVFLEKLMLSKSQDAKLIDRDFLYTIVEPASGLSEQQAQQIQQLGYSFARGGSRRERNADGTALFDPSISLLTGLGLSLDPQGGKQLLDLGLFCQQVFEPAEPPADSPMHDVKSSFRPVPRAMAGAASGQATAEPAADSYGQPPDPGAARGSSIDEIPSDEWLPTTPAPAGEPAAQQVAPPPPPPSGGFRKLSELVPGAEGAAQKSQRERLKDDLQSLLGAGGIFSEGLPPSPSEASAPPPSEASAPPPSAPMAPPPPAPTAPPPPEAPAPPSPESFMPPPPPKNYAKGLNEQVEIVSPTAPPEDSSSAAPAEQPAQEVEENPPGQRKLTLPEDAERLAQRKRTLMEDDMPAMRGPAPADWSAPAAPVESAPEAAAEAVVTPPPELPADAPAESPAAVQVEVPTEPPPETPEAVQIEIPAEVPAEVSAQSLEAPSEEPTPPETAPPPPSPPPAPSARPAARDSKAARSPSTAGTGMESLVSRLEQQVTKATTNLVTQVDQIHSGLESEIKKLLDKVTRSEAQNESDMTASLQAIDKQLDELTEDSRLRVSDAAANGRYSIKQLLDKGQRQLDDTQKESLNSLMDALTDFKASSEKMAESIRQKLSDMVESQSSELSGLVDSICEDLNQTNRDFSARMKTRFDRLRDRLGYEGESIGQSLDRHVNSLREDLEGLCERAFDKVKSNKSEREIGLRQFVTMYELNLSQTMNRLTSNMLIPKLREYREGLRNERSELEKQLAGEASEQGREHLSSLNECKEELKQQLQQLLSESLAKIESMGEEQKGKLSKIFKDTGDFIETGIEKAQATFQQAEVDVAESDGASRKLVEASGAGTDPVIAGDKESAVKIAQQLKENALNELNATFDQQCEKLDKSGQILHTKLTKAREKHTQSVSDAADEALNLIRKAIQDASAAIRSAQEKYME